MDRDPNLPPGARVSVNGSAVPAVFLSDCGDGEGAWVAWVHPEGQEGWSDVTYAGRTRSTKPTVEAVAWDTLEPV